MLHSDDFRENLARLNERFPGRDSLRIPEVAQCTGFCEKTLRASKNLPRVKVNRTVTVPIVALARFLSCY